jgi:hypothetical protein
MGESPILFLKNLLKISSYGVVNCKKWGVA